MNILHLDTSILGQHSVSRTLSASVTARLRASDPNAVETYRDLSASPLPHLSGAYLAASRAPAEEHNPGLRDDLALGATVLQEFLAADVVVIGVAFYNFTIPTQLKAWIDRILVAGQTFAYGSDGRPVGLSGGKRVILTIARGGFYGEGAPAQAYEHAETYLRSTFGFIGIADLDVVVAEGLAAGPDQRHAGLARAEQQIATIAA